MAYNDLPKPDLKVGPDQPVDDIVSNLMQVIARKGRGFALSNEGGKIEVVEQPPVHDEWQDRAPLRAHQINDTASLIEYAVKYGNADDSFIVYIEVEATLSLKETIERGQRDLVHLPFKVSPDWADWTQLIGRPQLHKALLTFLLNHEHNLTDPTILQSMSSFGINSKVTSKSEVKDTGASVSFIVETNGNEEMKTFPKAFQIALAVLDQDLINGAPVTVPMRLVINMPDDPTKPPTFTLFCAAWEQIRKRRIDDEAKVLKDGLDGWTVVAGIHQTEKPYR
jgi:hypothetical protein